jgi:hypothetical protein
MGKVGPIGAARVVGNAPLDELCDLFVDRASAINCKFWSDAKLAGGVRFL